MNRLEIAKLLDTQYTLASDIFEGKQYPYEVLPETVNFIKKSDKTLVSIKLDNQKNKNKFKEIRRDFRRPCLDWMRLHL